MATKTVTYCDITNEVCHRTFRIGMSDSDAVYILELSEQGMRTLLGELISGIKPDVLNDILVRLVGSNWKETLNQQM
jgi:hypothetical protein